MSRRKMYRRTLGLKESVLGEEDPDTLASMNNLTEVLRLQGKYDQAEETRNPVQILTPILSFNRD
jgi:hypothetical protein